LENLGGSAERLQELETIASPRQLTNGKKDPTNRVRGEVCTASTFFNFPETYIELSGS